MMTRMIFSMIITLTMATSAHAVTTQLTYDTNIDYSKAMYECAKLGDECSMALGHVYELQRNMKLKDLGLEDETTSYFSPDKTGNDILIEMMSDRMKKEYAVAGYVYEQLAKNGYSDVCIAGILGNMMNETGGNTLSLNPYIYELEYGMHYGLCQWSLVYHKEINGGGLEEQIAYLIKTIGPIFEQFKGRVDEFKILETPEEAAGYFSTYYERGGNTSQRKKNARKAYEWIMGFKE